jgi:hypothetical protein
MFIKPIWLYLSQTQSLVYFKTELSNYMKVSINGGSQKMAGSYWKIVLKWMVQGYTHFRKPTFWRGPWRFAKVCQVTERCAALQNFSGPALWASAFCAAGFLHGAGAFTKRDEMCPVAPGTIRKALRHAAFVSAPRVGCGKKTTKIIWGDEHPLGTQLVAPSLGCFSPRGCFFVSHGDINVDCHPHLVYLSVQSTMKAICRSG